MYLQLINVEATQGAKMPTYKSSWQGIIYHLLIIKMTSHKATLKYM